MHVAFLCVRLASVISSAVALFSISGVAPGLSGAVNMSFERANYSSLVILIPRWQHDAHQQQHDYKVGQEVTTR
jgi:hypothetical protein